MSEPNIVFKALQLTPEGKLISLRAQSRDGSLDYKVGQITYAPEGSMGVFVKETLDFAQTCGIANCGYAHAAKGIVVIHKSVALGTRLPYSRQIFGDEPRYPAILLQEEVWREKLTRPEPKFKLTDRLDKDGEPVTITKIIWAQDDKFSTHEHYHYSDTFGRIWDEAQLELAPEEAWVDVTGECTVEIQTVYGGHFYARFNHGGCCRLILGEKPTLWGVRGGQCTACAESNKYKVEFEKTNKNYYGFKILYLK
jgi:hypothetical protein